MTTVVSSKDLSRKSSRSAGKRSRKAAAPTEEEIRILAYDLYERRQADGGRGDATSDWIEAERLLSGTGEG
jgi:hypothetical protein